MIKQELELLRQEIMDDKNLLSKVKIVTDDYALLEVLGDSGVRMVKYMDSDSEEDEDEKITRGQESTVADKIAHRSHSE